MTPKVYQMFNQNISHAVRILILSLCLYSAVPLSVHIEYQYGVGKLEFKQSVLINFNQEKGE